MANQTVKQALENLKQDKQTLLAMRSRVIKTIRKTIWSSIKRSTTVTFTLLLLVTVLSSNPPAVSPLLVGDYIAALKEFTFLFCLTFFFEVIFMFTTIQDSFRILRDTTKLLNKLK